MEAMFVLIPIFKPRKHVRDRHHDSTGRRRVAPMQLRLIWFVGKAFSSA
jgi:hypothetical protein